MKLNKPFAVKALHYLKLLTSVTFIHFRINLNLSTKSNGSEPILLIVEGRQCQLANDCNLSIFPTYEHYSLTARDPIPIGNLARLCDLRKTQLRTENLEWNLY